MEEGYLYDVVQRGECEDNVRRDDVETTRISKDIYIRSSVVLQTQLRSGLYNSSLTRTPGSEGVRNTDRLSILTFFLFATDRMLQWGNHEVGYRLRASWRDTRCI